jgi:hypothetical protein
MKSDLIILRYKTENVIGTKTSLEPKTFFGSKMVDIEDLITLDNSEIQYSEMYDSSNKKIVGYQYIKSNVLENTYLRTIDSIKEKYSKITLLSQNETDMALNTQWELKIDWIKLLSDYLFYKLKEMRTFKCIKYSDVVSENINYFIYDYIKQNLLSRYKVSNIEFYVKYLPLDHGDQYTTPNLMFDPLFNTEITSTDNYIKNINSTITPTNIIIKYKQTQPSSTYKFDYYYNLYLEKI